MIDLLAEFVTVLAEALNAANRRRPAAVGPGSGRIYQSGIGPHPEDCAADLIVAELNVLRPVANSVASVLATAQ